MHHEIAFSEDTVGIDQIHSILAVIRYILLKEAEMNEPRIREITDEEAAELEKMKNGSVKTSSTAEGCYQICTDFFS